MAGLQLGQTGERGVLSIVYTAFLGQLSPHNTGIQAHPGSTPPGETLWQPPDRPLSPPPPGTPDHLLPFTGQSQAHPRSRHGCTDPPGLPDTWSFPLRDSLIPYPFPPLFCKPPLFCNAWPKAPRLSQSWPWKGTGPGAGCTQKPQKVKLLPWLGDEPHAPLRSGRRPGAVPAVHARTHAHTRTQPLRGRTRTRRQCRQGRKDTESGSSEGVK